MFTPKASLGGGKVNLCPSFNDEWTVMNLFPGYEDLGDHSPAGRGLWQLLGTTGTTRFMAGVRSTDVGDIRSRQGCRKMGDPPFDPNNWKTIVCDTFTVTICRSGQRHVYIFTHEKHLCRVEVKADHHPDSGLRFFQAMRTSSSTVLAF